MYFKYQYNKLCKCCSCNDIEGEYHFIFVCPCYLELRQKLFNFLKHSVLLSINDVKELCILGNFFYSRQQYSEMNNFQSFNHSSFFIPISHVHFVHIYGCKYY